MIVTGLQHYLENHHDFRILLSDNNSFLSKYTFVRTKWCPVTVVIFEKK